jgi:hypothetical protein
MKTKISNSKPVIAHPPAEAGSPSRTWITGARTSRADAVDAAFDEESFSFVAKAEPESESSAMVQSLSSQLAMLESQCEQLRKILVSVSS